MAFPATQPFPAPQLFPVAQPDAQTFGLMPQDAAVQPALQSVLPAAMTVGAPTFGAQTARNGLWVVDQQLGTNLSAGGDPGGWTPEMAAAQTDKALAKIAQANPEVAATLQEQRTGAAPTTGGGVLGFMKQAVGAVAGLPVISQALDIMSRAGHIVPEILSDEEGQSVWGNIGQALAGHSDKQMINVLDKYGVLTGDGFLEQIAQSALGFGLDLAVDPTTYLTMGLGAVGRQAAAKFGSEALAKASLMATEEGLNILDHAAATYGMRVGGELTQTAAREAAFKQLWKEATGVVGEMGKSGKYGALTKELALTSADAAPGLLGFAMSNGQEKVWLSAMKAADAGHSIITTSGLTKLGPKLAAELGVPIEEVEAVLKGLKTSGQFGTRAEYTEAKIAGALQGGVRFAIPGVRIITPALFAGMNVDFSIARRFMSGLSGQTRLMRLIESGAIDTGAGAKALKAFWKGESEQGLGGFSAMRAASPKTAEQLAGGGLMGGMRMATYSASEQVGRWTRAFSPSWQVVRGGGLGAQIASDARRMAQHVAEGARGEIWGLKRNMEEDTRLLDHVQSDESFAGLQQPTRRVKKGAKAAPENVAELTPAVTKEYLARKLAAATQAAEGGVDEVNDGVLSILNAFPTQAAYDQGMGYFDELDQLLENRINAGLVNPKDVEVERAALKKQRELGEKALAAGAKSNDVLMAARVSRAVIGQGRRYGHEMGVFVESSQLTLRSSSFVHPSDAKAASEGAHQIVQDTQFRYMDEAAVDPTAGPGVHPQAITDGTAESGGLRGHVMVEERTGVTRPAQNWQQEPVWYDEGVVLDEAHVVQLEAEAKPLGQTEQLERVRILLRSLGVPESDTVMHQLDTLLGGGEFGIGTDAANKLGSVEKALSFARVHASARGAEARRKLDDALNLPTEAEQAARNARSRLEGRKARGATSGNPYHHVTEEVNLDVVEKYLHPRDLENAERDVRDIAAGNTAESGLTREEYEALKQDMRDGKLNEPIVMEYDPDTGAIMLRDGHHRVLAAREIGWDRIPMRVEIKRNNTWLNQQGHFIDNEDIKLATSPGDRLPQHMKPSEVFAQGTHASGPVRSHVISFQNPVVLDLRAPVQGQRSLSTSVMGLNPLTEADREAKEALDALEVQYMDALEAGTKVTDERAKKMLKDLGVEDPDVMTERMIKSFFAEKQAMLAELKTRRLREQGYDGAVVIQPDGTRVATVFDTVDDSLPRMHHVAKNAPRSLPNQGFFPLEFTDAARAATRSGNKDSVEAGRVIRGGSKFERDLAQKLAHLSPADAEKAAQAELRAAGISLPDGAKVFNTDPLQVVDSYADQMAAGGVRTFLGRVAQKLDIGGFTANPLVGGPGHATYQYITNINEEWLKKLQNENANLYALADRAARMGAEVQDELAPQLQALEGSVINIKEYLHAKYDAIDNEIATIEIMTPQGIVRVREGDVIGQDMSRSAAHVVHLENTANTAEQNAAIKRTRLEAFHAGNDQNFVYHWGRQERMEDYRREGLNPSTPGDAAVAPNAAYSQPGVYFGASTKEAYDLLPMNSARGAVPLRVHRETLRPEDVGMPGLTETGRGGEALFNGNIEAQYIEFLGADGNWHRLIDEDRTQVVERAVYEADQVTKRLDRATKLLIGATGSPVGEDLGGGVYRWARMGSGQEPGTRPMSTYYYKVDAAGENVIGMRVVDGTGDVSAFTHPDLQGKAGIGTELAHAHWKDEGFNTPEQVLESIKQQSLSALGVKSNQSYIKSYFDPGKLLELKGKLTQLDEVSREIQQRSAVIDNAANEANKLRASMKVRPAPVQPALVRTEQSMAGMTELSLPGIPQSGMAMPAFMADEFHRAAYGYKSITGFHRTFRQFNTWWKGWATYRFPGFHVRNIEGAWFNNWLGGVGLGEYTHSARMMKAREELANGVSGKWANAPLGKDFLKEHGLESYYYGLPDPTYGDLQALAASVGITSAHGRAFMEARVTAEELEMRQAKRKNIIEKGYGPVGRTIEKGGRKAGDVTESMFRQAAFLKGLKDSGGDLGHARMFTMMRHGDYGDLTDFEYEKVRDLLPFYKWTRTNLPLQLHQLFEAPGKITAMLHLRDAAWNATGANYDEQQYTMPEWMRQGFSIPFGKGDNRKIVMLDLPFTDLYNGTNEYISQFLPLVRPLFESYVVDKSIFSGKPLTGKPIHAAFLDFGPLPSLLSSLNVGEIGPDGKYYLDDKMQNVMAALPMFARARDWLYEDPDRVGLRSNTLASAVFGLGFRPAGDDALSSQELNFYYTNILPTMEYMKGIGYQLPTSDDVEAAYGTANNALLSAGIAPGGPTQGATTY